MKPADVSFLTSRPALVVWALRRCIQPPMPLEYVGKLLNLRPDVILRIENDAHERYLAYGPANNESTALLIARSLSNICADGSVPPNVMSYYSRGYGRKPSRGMLGNKKFMAGAVAMARGDHGGPLTNAAQWCSDIKVYEIGVKHGLTFPGLIGLMEP